MATVFGQHREKVVAWAFTLLWKWQHYSPLAMALLCPGMRVMLLWQLWQSDVEMAVCCKGQQQ